MVAVFPKIMNGKLDDDVKDESIIQSLQQQLHKKQAVIYESGQAILKVECGTTLEVMKLLYESEHHKKNGDILGVRPRNTSEIPCIITLHESKLEESAYDVIIKDKKNLSQPNGYGVHEKNPGENCVTTRCIDCSRESWKSKRYTTVGMNTEISLNPLLEVDSLRPMSAANTYASTASTVSTYPPPRNRGRPPIQRPIPVATHGNIYSQVHKKDYMIAALPAMTSVNGLSNSEMEYISSSHYRSRSPKSSPPNHHNTGHTKICYPAPSKPITMDTNLYDQNVRPRIPPEPRSHSPRYQSRSPVYSSSIAWKKEPVDMYPLPHYATSNHKTYPVDMIRSPRRYPKYEPENSIGVAPHPPSHPPAVSPNQSPDVEPPVYVLPNDFDLQRDGVDPHILPPYHSPKEERNPLANSHERKYSEHIQNENIQPHSGAQERERDSPISDSSSKSPTDENMQSVSQNDQQLSCKICKQYFPTKSTLYKHLRGHTSDEKPFKCNECGQGFTLSSNLRQHRIIHRGYKPFQCEYCGKKFMRSNVYKQHRRIHTGEQMHKCDHCPSEFLQRYALIKHKKKAHNIETFDK